MSMPELTRCPGTLAEGHTSYSAVCLKHVFAGKKVSHILPYSSEDVSDEDEAHFIENRKRISISGAQPKLSLIQVKNKLRLTEVGEQGTHILKPIPPDLRNKGLIPANEHLTMQVAKQVFKIETAENAMIFFKDGTPAYITRRFDVLTDGRKAAVEDFASLSGRTADTAGSDFKYESSYEAMGALLKASVPSWRIEIERFFHLVVFNFLFSNGDAHLKNFSLIETPMGDHRLSPAYDLINTHLHVDDGDFALHHGLFAEGLDAPALGVKNREARLPAFIEFGRRIGLAIDQTQRLLQPFQDEQPHLAGMVHRSFLDEKARRSYLLAYETKRNRLRQ